MPKKYKNYFPAYSINRAPDTNRMKEENVTMWNIISTVFEGAIEPLHYLDLIDELMTNEFSEECSKSFIIHCNNLGWLYEVD